MANNYKSIRNNPILSLMLKNRLTKSDLCRLLDIRAITLNEYINNPGLIRLRDLHLLAGSFGVSVEELVYLLRRTKPVLKKEDKWYLEGIKIKADERDM